MSVLVYRLATDRPVPLAIMVGLFAMAYWLRPWLLEHTTTEDPGTRRRS